MPACTGMHAMLRSAAGRPFAPAQGLLHPDASRSHDQHGKMHNGGAIHGLCSFSTSQHKRCTGGPYPDDLASWRQLSGGICCSEVPGRGSAGQHAGQRCSRALRQQQGLFVCLCFSNHRCSASGVAVMVVVLQGLCRCTESASSSSRQHEPHGRALLIPLIDTKRPERDAVIQGRSDR